MNRDFQDRVVIVTGATGALGQTLTHLLLERGAQVIATYRQKGELDDMLAKLEAPQQANLTPFSVDVTDEKAVTELVNHVINQFHRIDGLANIVGGYTGQAFGELTFESWRQQFALNLDSAFLMTRAVLPTMVNANYGRIVSVGSRGAIQAAQYGSAYNAAKVGLMWLMETVSNEYRAYNVTANSVLPSIMDTPANRRAWPDRDFSQWVRTDEVGELICYLLSDTASGTSGAKVPVYGKA